MWADKRLQEPWLLNFLQETDGQSNMKIQGLHILKKVCGPRNDGSEIKYVTDGKLSIHGVFTKSAIEEYHDNYNRTSLEDEEPPEWNKCFIIVRKYNMNHLFNEKIVGCKFELVIESFSYWVSEEGFRLKEDPEYCMEVESLIHKSKRLWEKQREQMQVDKSETIGESGQLSLLIAELANDSQASLPADSQHSPIKCCEIDHDISQKHVGSVDGVGTVFLKDDMMDIRRFLVSDVDHLVLKNIKEWQSDYIPQTCYDSSQEKTQNTRNKSDPMGSTDQRYNCDISVQVGESLVYQRKDFKGINSTSNEKCAQVGESLIANIVQPSSHLQIKQIPEISSLPSDFVFHPVFLPDDTQSSQAAINEDKSINDVHKKRGQEPENQDNFILASTQEPSKKDIPPPILPLSPVRTAGPVRRVKTRSFVTQTTIESSHIYFAQSNEANQNKQSKEARNVFEESSINTSASVYKTCHTSPQNEMMTVSTAKQLSPSENLKQNKPIETIGKISPEKQSQHTDSEERNVLCDLAQKLPSSGESNLDNSVAEQTKQSSRLNIVAKIEENIRLNTLIKPVCNDKNRADKVCKNGSELRENSYGEGNASKRSKDGHDLQDTVLIEIIVNAGSKNTKIMKQSDSDEDLARERNSKRNNKANRSGETGIPCGITSNNSSEIALRRCTRSKSYAFINESDDNDEIWEPSPSKAHDKNSKKISKQKSVQKSRYSFAKGKSVTENIQGMLTGEKSTKHDSNVLFGNSSTKSGKKKRLSTRKKLYNNDNMLLCGGPSVSDTQVTLPSVSEEQEILNLDKVEIGIVIKQEPQCPEGNAIKILQQGIIDISSQPVVLLEPLVIQDRQENNTANGLNVHGKLIGSVTASTSDVYDVPNTSEPENNNVTPISDGHDSNYEFETEKSDGTPTETVNKNSTTATANNNSQSFITVNSSEACPNLQNESVIPVNNCVSSVPDLSLLNNHRPSNVIETSTSVSNVIETSTSVSKVEVQGTSKSPFNKISTGEKYTVADKSPEHVMKVSTNYKINDINLDTNNDISAANIRNSEPERFLSPNLHNKFSSSCSGGSLINKTLSMQTSLGSLPCAQAQQHKASEESSVEVTDRNQRVAREDDTNLFMDNETYTTRDGDLAEILEFDEDPDEDVLLKIQGLLDREDAREDHHNLLHLPFTENTQKAIHTYYLDGY